MVRLSTLTGATSFVVSASCLSVIAPLSDSELDLSKATKVEWSFSDSDPSAFDLYLLNQDKIPHISVEIGSNVTTSDKEYTLDGVDVLPGYGYVFNFKDVSSGNILAQSGEFTVVTQGSNTTTSSATSTATTTSTGSGSTSNTVTPTGAAVRPLQLPVAEGAMAIFAIMAFVLG